MGYFFNSKRARFFKQSTAILLVGALLISIVLPPFSQAKQYSSTAESHQLRDHILSEKTKQEQNSILAPYLSAVSSEKSLVEKTFLVPSFQRIVGEEFNQFKEKFTTLFKNLVGVAAGGYYRIKDSLAKIWDKRDLILERISFTERFPIAAFGTLSVYIILTILNHAGFHNEVNLWSAIVFVILFFWKIPFSQSTLLSLAGKFFNSIVLRGYTVDKNDANEIKKLFNTLMELPEKVDDMSVGNENITLRNSKGEVEQTQVKVTTKKPRILLVDDSENFRSNISDYLNYVMEGFEVVEADDGQDALNKLETLEPFDLIITDLEMPRIDGEKLIETVSKRANPPKIILESADRHKGTEIANRLNVPFNYKGDGIVRLEQIITNLIGENPTSQGGNWVWLYKLLKNTFLPNLTHEEYNKSWTLLEDVISYGLGSIVTLPLYLSGNYLAAVQLNCVVGRAIYLMGHEKWFAKIFGSRAPPEHLEAAKEITLWSLALSLPLLSFVQDLTTLVISLAVISNLAHLHKNTNILTRILRDMQKHLKSLLPPILEPATAGFSFSAIAHPHKSDFIHKMEREHREGHNISRRGLFGWFGGGKKAVALPFGVPEWLPQALEVRPEHLEEVLLTRDVHTLTEQLVKSLKEDENKVTEAWSYVKEHTPEEKEKMLWTPQALNRLQLLVRDGQAAPEQFISELFLEALRNPSIVDFASRVLSLAMSRRSFLAHGLRYGAAVLSLLSPGSAASSSVIRSVLDINPLDPNQPLAILNPKTRKELLEYFDDSFFESGNFGIIEMINPKSIPSLIKFVRDLRSGKTIFITDAQMHQSSSQFFAAIGHAVDSYVEHDWITRTDSDMFRDELFHRLGIDHSRIARALASKLKLLRLPDNLAGGMGETGVNTFLDSYLHEWTLRQNMTEGTVGLFKTEFESILGDISDPNRWTEYILRRTRFSEYIRDQLRISTRVSEKKEWDTKWVDDELAKINPNEYEDILWQEFLSAHASYILGTDEVGWLYANAVRAAKRVGVWDYSREVEDERNERNHLDFAIEQALNVADESTLWALTQALLGGELDKTTLLELGKFKTSFPPSFRTPNFYSDIGRKIQSDYTQRIFDLLLNKFSYSGDVVKKERVIIAEIAETMGILSSELSQIFGSDWFQVQDPQKDNNPKVGNWVWFKDLFFSHLTQEEYSLKKSWWEDGVSYVGLSVVLTPLFYLATGDWQSAALVSYFIGVFASINGHKKWVAQLIGSRAPPQYLETAELLGGINFVAGFISIQFPYLLPLAIANAFLTHQLVNRFGNKITKTKEEVKNTEQLIKKYTEPSLIYKLSKSVTKGALTINRTFDKNSVIVVDLNKFVRVKGEDIQVPSIFQEILKGIVSAVQEERDQKTGLAFVLTSPKRKEVIDTLYEITGISREVPLVFSAETPEMAKLEIDSKGLSVPFVLTLQPKLWKNYPYPTLALGKLIGGLVNGFEMKIEGEFKEIFETMIQEVDGIHPENLIKRNGTLILKKMNLKTDSLENPWEYQTFRIQA